MYSVTQKEVLGAHLATFCFCCFQWRQNMAVLQAEPTPST